jgi:signal transduction histidine kinase
LSKIAAEKEGYKFHIARLGVVNNYHRPDTWEQQALRTLQGGASEEYAFSEINGDRYYRYMRSLNFQKDPKAGPANRNPAIGIAITIPTAVSDQIHMDKVKRDVVSYSSVGGISLVFIIVLIWRFSSKISSVIDREMEENRLKAAMELAGAAAHEMRQPLAVVIGLSGILENQVKKGEDVKEALEIIKDQSFRIDDIIHKMLNITQYKTKDYINGIRIFDIYDQKKESGLN